MIEISHLTKKYGDHVAVDDLTLNIESGKIYGFLGPNGAGKSTTMNMITGYIAATEGTVKINGFDILKQPEEARKCVGYLPELPPLYMEMTVAEYLKFAADLKKIPKEKKRQYIEEAMELTKITDMKNRLIRNLSKGYRQRVGFAQAVLGYPEVIILDEPTVGLDPQQMIEIRELVRSLGKRHTVILSSHILSEVREVCEHIFIISKGRLAASDTTENLIARMSGEQEISLLLKGDNESVLLALKEIDGIASTSVKAASEKGCQRAILRAEKGGDIREQVFFAFANARIPILEMAAGSKSLEQVFLELTSQSGVFEHTGTQGREPEDTDTAKDSSTGRDAEMPKDSSTGRDAEMFRSSIADSDTEMFRSSIADSDTEMTRDSSADSDVEMAGDSSAGRDAEMTRDSSAGRDAEMTRDSSAGRDAEMTRDSSAGRDAEMPKDSSAGSGTDGSVENDTDRETVSSERMPSGNAGIDSDSGVQEASNEGNI